MNILGWNDRLTSLLPQTNQQSALKPLQPGSPPPTHTTIKIGIIAAKPALIFGITRASSGNNDARSPRGSFNAGGPGSSRARDALAPPAAKAPQEPKEAEINPPKPNTLKLSTRVKSTRGGTDRPGSPPGGPWRAAAAPRPRAAAAAISVSPPPSPFFRGPPPYLLLPGNMAAPIKTQKHGFPSKHKHVAAAGPRSAPKTRAARGFSRRHVGAAPGTRLARQDNAPAEASCGSSRTRRAGCRYSPEDHIVTENSPSSVFICTCFCSHFLPPASAPLK